MIVEEFRRKYSWIDKKKNKTVYCSTKMIRLKCDKCDLIHERDLSHYTKMTKVDLFDKDYCNKCWRSILNNRPEKIKKMSDALKKVWSDPKKRQEMSIMMKNICAKTGRMIGDNNPMKNPETQKKVGKTRSERMTKEERKKYSLGSKKAWEDGKYIGANTTGKCVWHDYVHSNGELYKVQGTWELAFIKWLDRNNMTFSCHIGRIPYVDANGKERNYYPDFYVNEWKCYIDVKSDYWHSKEPTKFDLLKEQHPNNPIKLLFKRDLENLGIKI